MKGGLGGRKFPFEGVRGRKSPLKEVEGRSPLRGWGREFNNWI